MGRHAGRHHVSCHRVRPIRALQGLRHEQPQWGWLADGNTSWIDTANQAQVDLVIAGHNHRFSYTPPGPGVAHKYHLLVLAQDQVARVDAAASELKVVVSGSDGNVVQTLTIAARTKRGD